MEKNETARRLKAAGADMELIIKATDLKRGGCPKR